MNHRNILRSGVSLMLVLVILTSLVVPVSALSGDQLTATGACVLDAKTGEILWSYNGDTHHVPASLTKVMTVYLVFEAISAGTISKDTVVPISSALSRFSVDPTWSNIPLTTYSTYTVDDLLSAVIVSSGCAATRALGELVGGGSESACVTMMNAAAQDLGIDCYYYDTFGGSPANHITPNGLAVLVDTMLQKHPDYLTYSSKTSYTVDGYTYYTTNKFLNGTFSCVGTVDGIKTGTSSYAGHCLCTSAYQGDRRIITVALHCSSADNRYYDTQKLLSYGFAQLDAQAAAGARYAEPGTLTLTLEQNTLTLGAYSIGGSFYVSPRDVALLLRGTSAGFSVEDTAGGLVLNPGQTYAPNGSELSAAAQRTRMAQPVACTVSGVGALSCYRIDGIDYVNLPTLLSVLGAELQLSGNAGAVTLPKYVEPFRDVRQDAWYGAAVDYVYQGGIMNGTSGRTFAPEAELSRAMAVQVLYNLEGRPELEDGEAQFTDVPADAWYAEAVQWAAAQKIVNGREDDQFEPEADVTRQELVSILYRYENYKAADTSLRDDLSTFSDSAELADYAVEPMQWAVAQGVISGMENRTLQPESTATRAQMAQIMKNLKAA